MNDFNMNTKPPASAEAMPGFVRKNSVQSQPLQSKASNEVIKKTKTETETETEKQQETVTEKKSPVDFIKEASKEELDKTVVKLNDSLQVVQRNLEFSIDKELGQVVINVIDKKTKDIVRQIPSEEVLELAKNLHKISKEATEKLEERMVKMEEQSPDILNGGGFLFKGKA